jgi:hypothetical protein
MLRDLGDPGGGLEPVIARRLGYVIVHVRPDAVEFHELGMRHLDRESNG